MKILIENLNQNDELLFIIKMTSFFLSLNLFESTRTLSEVQLSLLEKKFKFHRHGKC